MRIVAGTAIDLVGTIAAGDDIVAAVTIDGVGELAAGDGVAGVDEYRLFPFRHR